MPSKETNMRTAMRLFHSPIKLTKEQYEEFCKLADELDLTVQDVFDWEQMDKTLDNESKCHFINS